MADTASSPAAPPPAASQQDIRPVREVERGLFVVQESRSIFRGDMSSAAATDQPMDCELLAKMVMSDLEKIRLLTKDEQGQGLLFNAEKNIELYLKRKKK